MIKIHNYRDTWPEEFHQISAILCQNLGDLALRIDHIGSTSVPGLAAKDVIDIQITVVELNADIIARMVGLGYSVAEENGCDHRPPEWTGPDSDWQKLFFNPPVGQRRTNTHVRVAGRPNQRYPLLFRDYLRSHPASAGAYAELKRRLADNLADFRTYPDVKDPAVDLIYFAAEDWAMETGWQPGPSDA
jgi:GrpB-like predicted nucleotidyltransferase (UPF0157 family)